MYSVEELENKSREELISIIMNFQREIDMINNDITSLSDYSRKE